MSKPDPMLDMAIVEALHLRGDLYTYVVKNIINAPWSETACILAEKTTTAKVRRRLQKMETVDLVERAPTNSGTHHCWRLRALGHDIYKNWLSAAWGPLPSTAPWPDSAPTITTGFAVGAADKCVRHIENVNDCLRLIMRLSAEPGNETKMLDEIHRVACSALQGAKP